MRKKLLPDKFSLSECEATIQLVEKSDDKGYGVAFLNIKFPDGRWIAFKSIEAMRVEMYEEASFVPKPSTEAKE